ncbi:hypothetical protein AB4254_08270 [Vibrio breoganii]
MNAHLEEVEMQDLDKSYLKVSLMQWVEKHLEDVYDHLNAGNDSFVEGMDFNLFTVRFRATKRIEVACALFGELKQSGSVTVGQSQLEFDNGRLYANAALLVDVNNLDVYKKVIGITQYKASQWNLRVGSMLYNRPIAERMLSGEVIADNELSAARICSPVRPINFVNGRATGWYSYEVSSGNGNNNIAGIMMFKKGTDVSFFVQSDKNRLHIYAQCIAIDIESELAKNEGHQDVVAA